MFHKLTQPVVPGSGEDTYHDSAPDLRARGSRLRSQVLRYLRKEGPRWVPSFPGLHLPPQSLGSPATPLQWLQSGAQPGRGGGYPGRRGEQSLAGRRLPRAGTALTPGPQLHGARAEKRECTYEDLFPLVLSCISSPLGFTVKILQSGTPTCL